jgi:hypothetical protein
MIATADPAYGMGPKGHRSSPALSYQESQVIAQCRQWSRHATSNDDDAYASATKLAASWGLDEANLILHHLWTGRESNVGFLVSAIHNGLATPILVHEDEVPIKYLAYKYPGIFINKGHIESAGSFAPGVIINVGTGNIGYHPNGLAINGIGEDSFSGHMQVLRGGAEWTLYSYCNNAFDPTGFTLSETHHVPAYRYICELVSDAQDDAGGFMERHGSAKQIIRKAHDLLKLDCWMVKDE